MPKSSKKRKNGKVKKYKPKPQGISKTKLNKLLKAIRENENLKTSGSDEVLEIRADESILQIEDPTKKKYHIVSSESNIIDGPELSKKEEENLPEE